MREKENWSSVLLEAGLMSWAAAIVIGLYVGINLAHGSPLVAGAFGLLAALLAMNGLARTELWFTSRGPGWWKAHPVLRIFHHVTEEGEMAGILVGLIVLVTNLSLHGGEFNVHFPVSEAFTLFGIMSVASATVVYMMPILEVIASKTGVYGVIFFGSILSSFTGEPAAAVFLSRYVDETVEGKNRAKVATGLAATIGSGGGLMPFAAPPILIVWGVLSSQLGWSILSLFLYVGVISIAHVAVVAVKVHKYLPKNPAMCDVVTYKLGRDTWLSLALLGFVVAINIAIPHNPVAWAINGLLGLGCIFIGLKGGKHFHDLQQPLILGLLLVALEVIGHEADPLLQWGASFIPSSWNVLVIGLVLWYASAFTSHFADNALASRVYMSAALTLGVAAGGGAITSFLAACVVLGALFGGFALIPANLPNFAISKILRVSPGEWAATATKEYYYSMYVHVLMISGMYFIIIP